ncbi:uncharacterized protein [Diadema antillarum]|uniref:uncharacterized protein n=1 Tax=Diadema antillarum TaxID=105358 RepID=UPI003A87E95B
MTSQITARSIILILLVIQQSFFVLHARDIQTCDAECESSPRYGRLSCNGRHLQCVPDPCCKRDTRHLNLAENQLTHLKIHAFQSFPRLKILDLRQNAIANVASGAFGNLGELQVLDLRVNRVRHLFPGMFTGLTGLKKLYLANNDIETMARGTFTEMTNLLSLKLNYNRINVLQNSVFLPLQSLQRLYLYGNRIAVVQERAFRGLTKVRTISLADNPLQTLPNVLPYVPAMSHLRLHNAPIICDCRMEFLRAWLRRNLYDAYESYAMCQTPSSLHGTPIYRIQTPLQCGGGGGYAPPVSREDGDPRADANGENNNAAPSDSESDYSEYSETMSEHLVSPAPKTGSQGSGSKRGTADTGRPHYPSTTTWDNSELAPLTPRVTVGPDQEAETQYFGRGHRTGASWDISPPASPSKMTYLVNEETPEGGVTEQPRQSDVSASNSNSWFVDNPRRFPENGSSHDPSWPHNGEDGSDNANQDDSTPAVTPRTSPNPKEKPAAEEPQGPPQTWGLLGSSAIIDCPIHVHDVNVSSVKWLTPHGKLVMSNSSRYGISGRGSLIVHNLQAYDHGTYRCIVRKSSNSVKMLPARLVLACPCHEKPKEPSFEPSINTTRSPHADAGSHPHNMPPPFEPGCSSVPMVVAIVTTFQATVALCVITFCLCCSKNINSSIKERACTGVPEPIAVVDHSGKFHSRSRNFARSSDPTSLTTFSTRGSESYEALTDRFAPRQSSSVRSFESFYDVPSPSDYVNYRKPKDYMYMIGYVETSNGRRAIGYRSSAESQCASIKEVTNENIYVTKD